MEGVSAHAVALGIAALSVCALVLLRLRRERIYVQAGQMLRDEISAADPAMDALCRATSLVRAVGKEFGTRDLEKLMANGAGDLDVQKALHLSISDLHRRRFPDFEGGDPLFVQDALWTAFFVGLQTGFEERGEECPIPGVGPEQVRQLDQHRLLGHLDPFSDMEGMEVGDEAFIAFEQHRESIDVAAAAFLGFGGQATSTDESGGHRSRLAAVVCRNADLPAAPERRA